MSSNKTAGKTKKKKPISAAHRAFIDEYIANGYNATRAYLKVYPKSNYESARRAASLLLTNIDIQEAVSQEFSKKVMKREEVLARLSDMGRATHHPFIEIDDQEGTIYFDFSSPEAKSHLHLIKKIKTQRKRRVVGKGEDGETWEHEYTEVELHDAKDALKLIGEHEKLFKPEEGDPEKFTAPQVVEIIKTYEEKRDK